MKLQDFLRENGTDSLRKIEELGVRIVQDTEHPNLLLFKYNSLGVNWRNPILRECRGAILDSGNNWSVVSYPYSKFFNYGEGDAAILDLDSVVAYEKLDGSLLTLYNYKGEWRVSTTGRPEAAGETHNSHDKISFNQLFWSAWRDCEKYELPKDTNLCYMFELMTPKNRVVVRHTTSSLVLHGARELFGEFRELSPVEVARKNGWRSVKQVPFEGITKAVESANKLSGVTGEGYVLCDKHFNRVKIKGADYLRLHYLKSSLTKKNITKAVLAGESGEFLNAFPEYKKKFFEIRERVDALCDKIRQAYDSVKDIKDQKEFALKVKDLPYSTALFQMRSRHISPEVWLSHKPENSLKILEEVECVL